MDTPLTALGPVQPVQTLPAQNGSEPLPAQNASEPPPDHSCESPAAAAEAESSPQPPKPKADSPSPPSAELTKTFAKDEPATFAKEEPSAEHTKTLANEVCLKPPSQPAFAKDTVVNGDMQPANGPPPASAQMLLFGRELKPATTQYHSPHYTFANTLFEHPGGGLRVITAGKQLLLCFAY